MALPYPSQFTRPDQFRDSLSLFLRSYPLYVEGHEVIIKPHHLRYMYGAILLATGATQETVVQNMGYRGSGTRGVFRSDSLLRLATRRGEGRGKSRENEVCS